MAEEVESQEEERILAHQEGREALTPWFGWVFGPAAWALHQGIGYAMVPWLCRIGEEWPYHALTAFSIALCGAGALAARRAYRMAGIVRQERGADRLRMMALGGFMLCAAALGGIIVEYAGSFWLEVCAGVA